MGQLRIDAPPILYKYRGLIERDTALLLEARSLYCSSPLALDDPFDCYPSLVLPPLDQLDEAIEQEVRSAPPELADEIRSRARLLIRSPAHRRRFLDEFFRRDLGRLGVVSLSKPRDHPLLWAHYASNFRGFAVGYRAQDQESCEALGAVPVEYTERRPHLRPFGDSALTTWLSILFSKSIHWAYQEEWRYVRMADDGGVGSLEVPEKCILEVCLGPRMATADRERVLAAALALPDRPDVLQLELDRDSYGMTFRRVE